MLYNLSDYFSIQLHEIPPNTDLQNMKEGFKAIIYCFPDSYYREEDYGKKVFPTYFAKKINNQGIILQKMIGDGEKFSRL